MGEKTEKSFHQVSSEVVNLLAVLIKTLQIHDHKNIAVSTGIEKLIAIINPIIEEEDWITIEIINEFFYFNKNRMRYDFKYLTNTDFLSKELKRRNIGSITFNSALTKNQVKLFLTSFIKAGFDDSPFEHLKALIAEAENIIIEQLKTTQKEDNFDRRKLVKKTYFNAVSMTKGIMNKIKSGEKISLKKAKRIIESTVDKLIEEESLLIGMTVIKDYDDYTFHHSVNVSILSMALGHRIGLKKKSIAELGLTALFHDIGKIDIPEEILNKPASFTEDEMAIVRKHPVWGVKAILKIKGFDENSIRSAIVSFEHHLHYNLSGYPSLKTKTFKLDLFSKIVTIADQYDAMTSSRVYSRIPLTPGKALSIMVNRIDTELDPHLTKFFINMVGTYPIGSLVVLNTREMGIVLEGNTNPAFIERPRILIVMDSHGIKTKEEVDLMEKDNGENFKRTIVKTLDPNKYKINLAEYIL